MKISRLAAVLAATIGMLALPATAHADVSAAQAFAADSGDSCRYGSTAGNLTWRMLSGSAIAVGVNGRLADRPLPVDPVAPCADDRRYSIATFVAYHGNLAVDRQASRVDNNTVAFQFVLGTNSTVSRIDRLVVQVCRYPSSSTGVSYCGRPAEYRPIVITP